MHWYWKTMIAVAGAVALTVSTAAQEPAVPPTKGKKAEPAEKPAEPAKADEPAETPAADPAKKPEPATQDEPREATPARRPTKAIEQPRARSNERADDRANTPRREGREAARDARATGRDARQEGREEGREAARSTENVRAADLGLWFSSRAGTDGLIIADIAARGAIAAVGFREGDRIISVNEQLVTTEDDFLKFLGAEEIRNQRVKVVVMRGGREQIVFVQPALIWGEVVAYDPLWRYGLVIDDRFTDRIVVMRVYPRTPAYYAGLRTGDVIVGLRGQRIAAVADLATALSGAEGRVAIQVNRANRTRDLEIDADVAGGARTALRPNIDAETRIDGRGRIEGRETRPSNPAAEKPAPPGKPGDPQVENPAAEKPAARVPAPEKPTADRPVVPERAPVTVPGAPPAPGVPPAPATPPLPGTPRLP